MAAEPASIHASLRTDRCGGRVLMLVNTLNEYQPFTAPVPGSGSATALFENRQVTIGSGHLHDTLAPFGSAVYVLGASPCPTAPTAGVQPTNILINPSFELTVNVGMPFGYEAYDVRAPATDALLQSPTVRHACVPWAGRRPRRNVLSRRLALCTRTLLRPPHHALI